MIVIDIFINGERITTAGRADLSVLTTCFTGLGILGPESHGTVTVKDGYELRLEISGLSSQPDPGKGEHHAWAEMIHPKIGDEITIKIGEADTAEEPLPKRKLPTEEIAAHNEGVDRERFERAKKFYLENRERYET